MTTATATAAEVRTGHCVKCHAPIVEQGDGRYCPCDPPPLPEASTALEAQEAMQAARWHVEEARKEYQRAKAAVSYALSALDAAKQVQKAAERANYVAQKAARCDYAE